MGDILKSTSLSDMEGPALRMITATIVVLTLMVGWVTQLLGTFCIFKIFRVVEKISDLSESFVVGQVFKTIFLIIFAVTLIFGKVDFSTWQALVPYLFLLDILGVFGLVFWMNRTQFTPIRSRILLASVTLIALYTLLPVMTR
jgi:hypothetical protein